MKKIFFFGLILCAILIQACLIPTIHPLYTEDVLVKNSFLAGHWENTDEEDEHWYFEEQGNHYYLTQGSEHQAYFEIHIVQLGENLFFDFKPVDIDKSWKNFTMKGMNCGDVEMNGLSTALLMPIHMFTKAEIGLDEIRIWLFDPEWLEKLFEERKIRIKHEVVEDFLDNFYLITADSRELQKFVSKYADLEEAYVDYDNPVVLKRVKS